MGDVKLNAETFSSRLKKLYEAWQVILSRRPISAPIMSAVALRWAAEPPRRDVQ